MTEAAPTEVACPVCGHPMMLLHTIRRAFAENLNVFKCKPCGFSMTDRALDNARPGREER